MAVLRSSPCLAALGVVFRTVIAAPLTITLNPTGDFEEATYVGSMYFKVTEPDTVGSSCENVPVTAGEQQIQCGGDITLDLSTQDELTISFKAPEGFEIEIDGPGRTRVEFQAKVPCGGDGEFKYQSFGGSTFTSPGSTEATPPQVLGSNTGVLNFNADSSFVELGRCDGCGGCEVYTRVQYDGPIDNARFTEISWTVKYNQSNVLDGPQTYRYGTETYCWIRDPNSGSGRRLSELNTFKLVPLGAASTDSAMTVHAFSSFLLLLVAGVAVLQG
mmetsp:Transcript_28808/g.67121  ORF Transcript_28808/g.67121 Transcript_28808/m.67121 type:complete len:274 (-) Transcript_28808:57-878(-)|eukprot:CAMPEP_0171099968 /NCGR_PEP_ID=MMETSP0766_2-20121228/52676_1 /TAXON_ID=439317 /ORGANISM="Gambierdiscus australes, Strain CAWD 149" /LENGTH=273 /DNA_ID=CAMNT_0011559707 /DNA_START=66 /DNA_END=887 /DNA_ORIENTATION=+